jgi:hypothetical protein
MIWWKQRDQPNGHRLIDSVRGLTSELSPSGDGEEAIIDPATRDYNVTSINSDNFTFNGYVNTGTRGGSMVGWCWKAGGPPDLTSSPTKPFAKDGVQYETLSAANITAGTITPTAMSVNTDAGFSIVSYASNNTNTGSVAHGLNQKPDIVIQKNIDTASDWLVLTNLIDGSNDYLLLNAAASAGSAAGGANATTFVSWDRPTGDNLIVYCWHSVEGYSKFGSYTGNGLADGPFVYCGFRPAFVICKGVDVSSYWVIHDNVRNGYNGNNKDLYASLSQGDASSNMIDILSGGFKIRNTTNEINGNGSYIFMAFSEQPFKFSNAR